MIAVHVPMSDLPDDDDPNRLVRNIAVDLERFDSRAKGRREVNWTFAARARG